MVGSACHKSARIASWLLRLVYKYYDRIFLLNLLSTSAGASASTVSQYSKCVSA
jgi:hypothetical protein